MFHRHTKHFFYVHVRVQFLWYVYIYFRMSLFSRWANIYDYARQLIVVARRKRMAIVNVSFLPHTHFALSLYGLPFSEQRPLYIQRALSSSFSVLLVSNKLNEFHWRNLITKLFKHTLQANLIFSFSASRAHIHIHIEKDKTTNFLFIFFLLFHLVARPHTHAVIRHLYYRQLVRIILAIKSINVHRYTRRTYRCQCVRYAPNRCPRRAAYHPTWPSAST